jgi:hypothetical protein
VAGFTEVLINEVGPHGCRVRAEDLATGFDAVENRHLVLGALGGARSKTAIKSEPSISRMTAPPAERSRHTVVVAPHLSTRGG